MSYGPPGGDGFVDVTEVFVQASRDMDPEQLILTDGFTLYDSMSALEIGDPRMDSGMVLDEHNRPPFDPLEPLLPEEVCYILDRLIACEMQWHAGFTLSQTIYTSLYVHHLRDITPDMVPIYSQPRHDPARPLELVTVVIRAAVTGMLKSCDYAWREMSKGRVQDTEDWQAEKCSVSLLESMPVGGVHSQLEQARMWLLNHYPASLPYRDDLLDRILLRTQLLDLFRLDPIGDRPHFQNLLTTATSLLQDIRSRPAMPAIEPHARGFLTFDPYITRRLNSFIPLKILDVPPQETSWDALANLLHGWLDLSELTSSPNMSTWKVVGHLWATISPSSQRIPFLRSLTQSTFFDGYRIIGDFMPAWLVDRFFVETVGIEYSTLATVARRRWPSLGPPPLRDIEQKIIRIMIAYIKSAWYNPPRRRRYLSRSLLDWHALYHASTELVKSLRITDEAEKSVVQTIPQAALIWHLSTIREVVLSGFNLELYVPDERPLAYWYAAQVIKKHLSVLDELVAAMPQDGLAREELDFERSHLTALKAMCTGTFLLTLPSVKWTGTRMSLNFLRRYKWAFRPEYKQYLTPPVVPPDINEFLTACSVALDDERLSPRLYFSRAHDVLLEMGNSAPGWAGLWHDDRLKFIRQLSDASVQLSNVAPASISDLMSFDQRALDWDPSQYRWFPSTRTNMGS